MSVSKYIKTMKNIQFGGKMNIKDYVKYDDRSEVIINKRYNDRIEALLEKYNFERDNLGFLEKKEKLIKEREDLISSLKKKNMPICDESLLIDIAIAWAEANEYTSFTQAQREVLNEISVDGKEFDGDMLKPDPIVNYNYQDITLDEAKQMSAAAKAINPISESLIKESLSLFKRTAKLHNDTNNDCYIEFRNGKCEFFDGKVSHEIPSIAIRQFIDIIRGDTITYQNASELISKLQSITIPYYRHQWPSTEN